MENKSENTNYNSAIETKKSLKRTIIQLQKAIDLINTQKITDIPNLTVVDKLVESSNALIDYLQLRNGNTEEEYSIDSPSNNDILESELLENKKNYNRKKSTHKQQKFSLISLILIALLTISIFFNILNIIYYRNLNLPLEINNKLIRENPTVEDPIEVIEKDLSDNLSPSEINSDIKINNDILSENIPIDSSEKPEIVAPNNQEIIEQNQEKIVSKDTNNQKNINREKEEKIENEIEQSFMLINPEQYLFNSIKEQIDLITDKYGKKIINKVEANLKSNSLIIEISNDWYNLNENTQNNLVSDITDKIKSLDFYKFNLIDNEGNLLARNAIVGKKYLIIKRSINN